MFVVDLSASLVLIVCAYLLVENKDRCCTMCNIQILKSTDKPFLPLIPIHAKNIPDDYSGLALRMVFVLYRRTCSDGRVV